MNGRVDARAGQLQVGLAVSLLRNFDLLVHALGVVGVRPHREFVVFKADFGLLTRALEPIPRLLNPLQLPRLVFALVVDYLYKLSVSLLVERLLSGFYAEFVAH